jgi:hypothetical protein
MTPGASLSTECYGRAGSNQFLYSGLHFTLSVTFRSAYSLTSRQNSVFNNSVKIISEQSAAPGSKT